MFPSVCDIARYFSGLKTILIAVGSSIGGLCFLLLIALFGLYRYIVYLYSRLSLSRIQRDSLKFFEISVPRHITFEELRKK